VEVVFRPDEGGAPAQRYFHMDTGSDGRVLFETRPPGGGQFAQDVFVESKSRREVAMPGIVKQVHARPRRVSADTVPLEPSIREITLRVEDDEGPRRRAVGRVIRRGGEVDRILHRRQIDQRLAIQGQRVKVDGRQLTPGDSNLPRPRRSVAQGISSVSASTFGGRRVLSSDICRAATVTTSASSCSSSRWRSGRSASTGPRSSGHKARRSARSATGW
jgi:hypothetical protein